MIHGEKDAYIGPEIAQDLFRRGKAYKELWLVPEAKHNGCREADPAGIHRSDAELSRTVCAAAPVAGPTRRFRTAALPVSLADGFSSAELSSEVASPVAG